jgi:hypothetical protein
MFTAFSVAQSGVELGRASLPHHVLLKFHGLFVESTSES